MAGKTKDSVFTLLFNDEVKLKELYYALSGRRLAADTPLVINTLEDVLYMERLNAKCLK